MQNKRTESITLETDALPHLPDHEHEFLLLMMVEGRDATAAYRATHEISPTDTPNAVYIRAYRLKGTERMQEWRSAYIRLGQFNALVSFEDHIKRMRELSEEARKAGNYGAAVNAEHHVGKALGHYVDKIEVTGRDSSAERILKEWKKARGVETETQTRH